MARIVDENFEGTGYEESWSETVTAGNTLDEDAAIPGTPPNGAGSQCLKSINTAGGANAVATQSKTGQTINYVRFYLYVDSIVTNGDKIRTAMLCVTTINTIATRIELQKTAGGQPQLRIIYFSNNANQNGTFFNINEDQWYRVEYQYDVTNLLWELRIDGVLKESGTLTGTTRTPDLIVAGAVNVTGTGDKILYTDLVVWDDATWPGEEAGGGVTYPQLERGTRGLERGLYRGEL